ncbi:hypothetical protein L1887_51126 [Cichorium endivia]|nr:hypothetical protein L1887_51126 [Cichorium endivia]
MNTEQKRIQVEEAVNLAKPQSQLINKKNNYFVDMIFYTVSLQYMTITHKGAVERFLVTNGKAFKLESNVSAIYKMTGYAKFVYKGLYQEPQQIHTNLFDLIVTDPPYNIASDDKMTMKDGRFVTTKKAWGADFQDAWNSFEEYYEWLKPFFAEMQRVLKDDGSMIVFLDRNFASTVGYLLQKDFGLIVKNKLYFNKTNPTTSVRKNNYRSCVEEAIWIAKRKDCKLNFINQTEMKQVFTGNNGERRKTKSIHPCQKYGWMIEPMIERHSEPGDVVLDPIRRIGHHATHCGSYGPESNRL